MDADVRGGWDTLASRSCFCPSDQYDGSEYAELEPEPGECVTVEEQYEIDRSCESSITSTVDWYLMKKEKPFVDCTEMDAGCDGLFINNYDGDNLTCVLCAPVTAWRVERSSLGTGGRTSTEASPSCSCCLICVTGTDCECFWSCHGCGSAKWYQRDCMVCGCCPPRQCRFQHTVLFHPSALHSPAVGLNSANSAIWNMLNHGTGSISVSNHPMDDPRTRTSPATDVQVHVFLDSLSV
jgi:hypothetical protein